MFAQICRTILASGLLTCGQPMEQDKSAQALADAQSTAATGVSAPFIMWRDYQPAPCLITIQFADDVPFNALDSIKINAEQLRKSVTQGDRTLVCFFGLAFEK